MGERLHERLVQGLELALHLISNVLAQHLIYQAG